MDINMIKKEIEETDRKKVYNEKVEKLQKRMMEEGLDGMVCFKPQNTFLISGFNPILYSHPVAVIVPAEGRPVLLVHCLRADHSAQEAAIEDIRLFGIWADYKAIAVDPYDAIRIIIEEKGLIGKRIGYEGDFLPVFQYNKLMELTRASEMVDIAHMIKYFSAIKNEYEIDLMRLSSYLTKIGMRAALENIRKSEVEASMAAEMAMREAWKKDLGDFEVSGFGNTEGGIPTALWCYSLSGYRVPYGCECPNTRVPQRGEVSLPIVWAAIDGYHSEKERTVIIESLPENYSKAYDCMLKARQGAFEAIHAGVTVGEVYAAATQHYIDGGFEKYLPGRIGHGMGLSLHDFPSMDRHSKVKLEEGMCFTVEPGLNFAGWGSIRHSDTVVVLKDRCEILTADNKIDDYLVR